MKKIKAFAIIDSKGELTDIFLTHAHLETYLDSSYGMIRHVVGWQIVKIDISYKIPKK